MIEINELQVKYGEYIAIEDINLRIEKGDFFTLLGPSGSGKTTTLRTVAGFLTPNKGRVFINGKDMTRVPVEYRGIGMVFQSYALFPTMTVFDNIAYGLQIEKVPKEEIQDRVLKMIQLVDLEERELQKNVSELSGGQQQRVAIARTLIKEPEIVLFDEPLSNLDARLRKQLRIELKRIQQDTGLTAIYVTHDQEEALELSDQIAIFNEGRIEQVGTPMEVYNHSATEFVCNFIGNVNTITPECMIEINKQVSQKFDLVNRHYIRDERILLTSSDEQDLKAVGKIILHGTIVHRVFQGGMVTYFCDVFNATLRVLERNGSAVYREIGEDCTLVISEADILTYERG